MSAYNRYIFTKELYPNYVVLLVKKQKYCTYGNDKKVLEYIKFKDKTYRLRKRHINYLVLDELDIVEKYDYLDNELYRYLYLININKIFDKIKVVMSYKYDLL